MIEEVVFDLLERAFPLEDASRRPIRRVRLQDPQDPILRNDLCLKLADWPQWTGDQVEP